MKKALPLAIVMLFAASLFCWSAGRPTSQAAEVSLQKVEPFAYVCMRVQGSYSKIQETIGKLMMEIQAQNAAPTGPLMGVYYNSPEQVDPQDLEWEIGFPVTPRQGIQPPLTLKEWNYTQVAAALHKGPYTEAPKTIAKIMEWMAANGCTASGPVLERYLDMNPSEMKPADLRTEIWIPCQKK